MGASSRRMKFECNKKERIKIPYASGVCGLGGGNVLLNPVLCRHRHADPSCLDTMTIAAYTGLSARPHKGSKLHLTLCTLCADTVALLFQSCRYR